MKANRQTTALIIGSLLVANGTAAQTTKNNQAKALMTIDKNQQDVCLQRSFVNDFSEASLQQMNPYVTPIVNKQFIIDKITCPPELRDYIVDLTVELRAIHPHVKNYIDLVLTHLDKFQISAQSEEDIKNFIGHRAGYFPYSTSMLLPNTILSLNRNEMIEMLLHEYRHTVMQTMQQILGDTSSISCECYFPNTDKERAVVLNMLENGDKKVADLYQMLNLEAQNDLSENNKQMLTALRNASDNEYKKYHQETLSWTISKDEIKQYEQISKNKLTVNKIVNFDKYRMNATLGNLLVRKIEDTPNEPNMKTIKFIYQDPLQAFVHIVPIQINHVKKAYPEQHYILEREAYLHGRIPQALIEYAYADLYHYLQNLIQKTLEKPILYQPYIPEYRPLQELYEKAVIKILSTPAMFEANFVKGYMQWVDFAIEKNETPAAKQGLLTVIQKGFLVGEANLRLAQIYYSEGNYQEAGKHYKRAKKRNITFTATDHQNYATALSENGLLKNSVKEFKKAAYNFESQSGLDSDEESKQELTSSNNMYSLR